MIIINIAKDYSKMPGGRFAKEGPYSGEDFRKSILKPKNQEAKKKNKQLPVILDRGYGYATSFLEEAFGGLARELGDSNILNIRIISDEAPALVAKIEGYIRDALRTRG